MTSNYGRLLAENILHTAHKRNMIFMSHDSSPRVKLADPKANRAGVEQRRLQVLSASDGGRTAARSSVIRILSGYTVCTDSNILISFSDGGSAAHLQQRTSETNTAQNASSIRSFSSMASTNRGSVNLKLNEIEYDAAAISKGQVVERSIGAYITHRRSAISSKTIRVPLTRHHHPYGQPDIAHSGAIAFCFPVQKFETSCPLRSALCSTSDPGLERLWNALKLID
ncbi:hypothetical protein LshimejAT787_0701560 [Lyophyllum shimeji]|uniref:Uncharacterized protein n=1 Tax=Lyophyllum shimeji TaxID=47721 RepID=A0A9P3PQR3_LYOSH|nr:hypothetical protein LshimejAT787_0701560 [Lyophyllum shimeji]